MLRNSPPCRRFQSRKMWLWPSSDSCASRYSTRSQLSGVGGSAASKGRSAKPASINQSGRYSGSGAWPAKPPRCGSVTSTMRRWRCGLIGSRPCTSLTSVTLAPAAACATARWAGLRSDCCDSASGGSRCSAVWRCRPSAAFRPSTRVAASVTRASLSRPSCKAAIRWPRSASKGPGKSSMSQPLAITSGTVSARSAQLPRPAMPVASDTIRPLKPRARASAASTSTACSTRSAEPVAARPSWLGNGVPKGIAMAPPSMSPLSSSGMGLAAISARVAAQARGRSGPTKRVTPPTPSAATRATSSGCSSCSATLKGWRSRPCKSSPARVSRTQATPASSSAKGAARRWSSVGFVVNASGGVGLGMTRIISQAREAGPACRPCSAPLRPSLLSAPTG